MSELTGKLWSHPIEGNCWSWLIMCFCVLMPLLRDLHAVVGATPNPVLQEPFLVKLAHCQWVLTLTLKHTNWYSSFSMMIIMWLYFRRVQRVDVGQTNNKNQCTRSSSVPRLDSIPCVHNQGHKQVAAATAGDSWMRMDGQTDRRWRIQ